MNNNKSKKKLQRGTDYLNLKLKNTEEIAVLEDITYLPVERTSAFLGPRLRCPWGCVLGWTLQKLSIANGLYSKPKITILHCTLPMIIHCGNLHHVHRGEEI